jgi:hypothetical protein
MKYTSISITLLVVAVATSMNVSPAQTQMATATRAPMKSLFDRDICNPPCWFGRTPGESSVEDAEYFFLSFSDLIFGLYASEESVFDVESGHMVDGMYLFRWSETAFEWGNRLPSGVAIVIRQGIVDAIHADTNRYVTLSEALSLLGTPDRIIARVGQSASLQLAFMEPYIEVFLTNSEYECDMSRLSVDFWVVAVGYYSRNYLIGVPFHDERFVPPDTWQAWLNGEVDGSCRDAWRQLPVTTATPSPTQTAITLATPVSR